MNFDMQTDIFTQEQKDEIICEIEEWLYKKILDDVVKSRGAVASNVFRCFKVVKNKNKCYYQIYKKYGFIACEHYPCSKTLMEYFVKYDPDNKKALFILNNTKERK